jgi:acyl-CoA synthetase (AMP-forming)/AMP-acid ligase II
MADPALDQAAAAFVVLRAGAAPSEADLKKYCRDRLPAFKVPKLVRMVEALPRSGAGKVLKTELSAQLMIKPAAGEPADPDTREEES